MSGPLRFRGKVIFTNQEYEIWDFMDTIKQAMYVYGIPQIFEPVDMN